MSCFCEVGEVSKPLKAQHLDDLQNLTRLAWTSCGAAAEHVKFLSTPGQPYLTAYRKDRVTCSRYRILSHLYSAQGLERLTDIHLGRPRCNWRCVACEPRRDECRDAERLLALRHGADVWAAS